MVNNAEDGTFTLFPKFPLEVQFMVWKQAADDLPARVVVLNHNVPSGTATTRSQVKETIPALLHTCQEARRVTIERYTSVFAPPELTWTYSGSLSPIVVRTICKYLGLARSPSVNDMIISITRFMNHNPSSSTHLHFSDFATPNYNAALAITTPQFLNPVTDTLVVHLPTHFPLAPRHVRQIPSSLWGPWLPTVKQLKHLALRITGPARRPSLWFCTWFSKSFFNHAPELESLSILVPDICEVFVFTVDQHDRLSPGDRNVRKNGEWTWKLDTESQQFKEVMGGKFAGVTWRITLAKKGAVALGTLVKEWGWEASMTHWYFDKRRLCYQNRELVGKAWFRANRKKLLFSERERELQLLEGGDGQTYLFEEPF